MSLRLQVGVLLCCGIILISCSNGNGSRDAPVEQDDVPVEQVEGIGKANNELGFSVLSLLAGNDSDDANVFISPTSLNAALLLAYNGADGDTKAEFTETLQLMEWSDEEVNEAMYLLLDSIKKDTDDIEVTTANSLWLAEEYTFQEDYEKTMEQYFDAYITTINKDDDASADKINNWVSKGTNGKIEKIIESPLNPSFVALLVNVLYFNGKWQYEFDEAATEESPFYTKNEEIDVPFMSLQEELMYMENGEVQAIKLPYGEGEMEMQIFLPAEDVDMKEFVTTTIPQEWDTWQAEFQKETGMLTLPKFTMEYDIVLNDVLQELGIEMAFSDEAEFPNMVEGNSSLAISEVKQKTYVDVHEAGTEAAAATSVEIVETSIIADDEPFSMDVNRPFVFAITDNETDAMLFVGQMNDPSEE